MTITGISGYIGSHTTLLFLQDGGYRVRGTVRDKDNEAKIAPLRQALGEELFNRLELVNADLDSAEQVASAIEGSNYVVAIAAGIPNVQGPEEGYLQPAIDSTKSLMQACKQHGVRRFVMTSSMIAAMNCDPKPALINESHWSDPAICGGYAKAKTC